MAFGQISTSVTIINSGLKGYIALSLDSFDSGSASTLICSGSTIEVAGAFFLADGNITINASSWTAITYMTRAYLELTPSGTAGSQTLAAAWSSTAPTWSTSKQGWYASASSNVRTVASAYKNSSTTMFNKKILKDYESNQELHFPANPYIKSTTLSAISAATYIQAFDGTNLIGYSTNDYIKIYSGISSTLVTSIASPSSGLTAIAFDGTNLISADSGTDKIYIHNGIAATTTSSFSSPSSNLSGIVVANGNLISADSGTDKIYIHDGIAATTTSSFSSPSSGLTVITFDGTNLISYDSGTNEIYVHDGITSSILYSMASPAPNDLAGFAFTGKYLDCFDFTTHISHLIRYRKESLL